VCCEPSSAAPRPAPQFSLTRLIYLRNFAGDSQDESFDTSLESLQNGAISIGNFDGVHLGHVGLLRQLRKLADAVHGPAVAVTFDPHPAAILRPEVAPVPLTSMETRADRMGQLGIDALIVCRSSPELFRLTAEMFYQRLIRHQLSAAAIVEGPNFLFGRDRDGDVHSLAHWCQQDGIRFEVAPSENDDGQMISSSRIRQAIVSGDVEQASRWMSAPHKIEGRVVNGDARGRQIGFPTANLDSIGVVVPGPGVYGGMTKVSGKNFSAAIHVGPTPTFSSSLQSKVEVHLLDFQGDLYGQSLAVDVASKVRDIAQFASPEALVEQIQLDILSIRRWSESNPSGGF
jgi:riboflavin kinase / FMN adenylyltransferase